MGPLLTSPRLVKGVPPITGPGNYTPGLYFEKFEIYYYA